MEKHSFYPACGDSRAVCAICGHSRHSRLHAAHWYIGRKPHETGGDWPNIFKSPTKPTEESHPGYGYVVGPFRTRKTAVWFARHRYALFNSMAEAERLARSL